MRVIRIFLALPPTAIVATMLWHLRSTPPHAPDLRPVATNHAAAERRPVQPRWVSPTRADVYGSRSTDGELAAACERAAREADPERRNDAVRAALRAWTAAAPAAALTWANARADGLRSVALSTVAEVLVAQPARAVAIGRRWLQEHPATADEVGTIFVGALVRAEQFPAALQLIGASPPGAGESWLGTIFGPWAQRDPSAALDLAQALRDHDVHGVAFGALVKGWSQSAPEQLLDFALTLPAGEDRSGALQAGLDQWLLRDPTAAAAWMGQLGTPQERDQAVAAYLARTDALERPTATALALAERIADPTLRFAALQRVVAEWSAGRPPAEAVRYVEALPGLDSAQRQQLVAAVTAPPDGA